MNGFLLAEGAFSAIREGAYANGLTVASWLPYILTALGSAWVAFQKYGPVVLQAIAGAVKPDASLVTSVTVPQEVPSASGGGGVANLLLNLLQRADVHLPLLKWYFSLPAEYQASFLVALKERAKL